MKLSHQIGWAFNIMWSDYLKIKSKDDFYKRMNIQYNWIYGQFRIINHYFPVKPIEKVLEIGSGVGALIKILKEKQLSNLYSSELDLRASRYISEIFKINVSNEKIESDSFMNNHIFDKIYAFEVIEHLNNPNYALNKIYKKLNNNGLFIFSSPPPNYINLKDPTHIFVLDAKCWKRNLENTGFYIEKIIPLTGLPYIYKFSKNFSIHYRINLSLYLFNTTNFFICRKIS